MTLDQLNKLVRDTVTSLTVMEKVIKYYPNAPRPDVPYATVNIGTLEKIGIMEKKEEVSSSGLDIKQTLYLQYKAMVSVNFYRDDARQNAALFSASLPIQSVIEEWNLNKIALSGVSEVRDLTELFSSKHEERGQCDIFISFLLTPKEEDVIGIDAVRIIGDIEDGSKLVKQIIIDV